jgi:hypothetical protein
MKLGSKWVVFLTLIALLFVIRLANKVKEAQNPVIGGGSMQMIGPVPEFHHIPKPKESYAFKCRRREKERTGYCI